jgi:ketosteroid isomerase-like protein
MTMHTGALTYPVCTRESEAATNPATSAAAARWSQTWSRAWPAADVAAIAALYAPDAVFYSHPFRERQAPREYVEWAFADQADAECRFGEPVLAGDRAAVDWWAIVTSRDGTAETLAGTSLLRFDEEGLVIEQRDAWAAESGRHDLSAWAASPGPAK